MQATRRRLLASIASAALFTLLGQAGIADAGDLKVLSGFGMKPVLDEVGPQFERSAGHKLAIAYDSSGGMRKKIGSGEPFDLAIVTNAIVDELVKQGKIASPVVVARAGVGIAVKAGAPKPAIGSAEALKRALLGAKSIAHSEDGATAAHFARIGERLGITAELKTRARPHKGADAVAQAVADGSAEMSFSVVSAIRANRALDLVGPLPTGLQDYVVYSAGIGSAAANPEGARALVRFLSDKSVAGALSAKGLEPAPAK